MSGPLSSLGRAWDDLVDSNAVIMADLLRRTAGEMADALDHAARHDIEGAREWRDFSFNGRFRDEE